MIKESLILYAFMYASVEMNVTFSAQRYVTILLIFIKVTAFQHNQDEEVMYMAFI